MLAPLSYACAKYVEDTKAGSEMKTESAIESVMDDLLITTSEITTF